ncbi:MAG: PorT family protein [Barnesiella sp.]|nr:PorT family protein [Bacteroidales bacterium]MBD5251091.1 PorT family protein [Barnesiella sp.]MBD5345247.1 PorT family protein [Bacteroides sp.]
MKQLFRLIATIAITIAVSATAAAQYVYSPNLAVGVKAGATLSRMTFSPEVTQKFLPGFIAGASVRYTEENHFGLIGEINIEQRGWQEDFEEYSSDFNYQHTLTYIQIPLLTHIYFGSKTCKFFINLGPEFGYMISDHVKANFDYNDIASIPDFPRGYRTNEQLAMKVSNRFDYGISGGLGVELIAAKRNSILLEGRFYYGLGNIYPSSKRDFFSASRGMSIEITLGYMFRIK